jgi:hypothetical protein
MSDNLTEGPMEHVAMIEIPLERARQFRDLIAAVRHWRGGLIPSTSTGAWGPTKDLLEAITVFDRAPCDHPRSWRIYRDASASADEVCGFCGTTVVGGLTARPVPPNRPLLPVEPESDGPATSSPPESSSSAP